MKKSAVWLPKLALASHVKPSALSPFTPLTTDQSVTLPPNWGVKPPGNISWNEKQFGSAKTCASATGSGTWLVMRTSGQFADPRPFACQHVADEE